MSHIVSECSKVIFDKGRPPTTRDLKMKSTSSDIDISQVSDEQLPVAKHKLKGWKHFMGLYAGEHVAATEFVFGATFVALGATDDRHLVRLTYW